MYRMIHQAMLIQQRAIRYGRLIVFTVFLFSSLFVNAQQLGRFEVLLGTGLLVNHGSAELAIGRQTKMGYQIGIAWEQPITKQTTTAFRLLWDRKGFKEKQGYIDITDQTRGFVALDRTVNYLTIALVPTIKVGHTNWHVGAGGYYGFLSSSRDHLMHLDENNRLKREAKLNSKSSAANDVGFQIELRYSWKVKRYSLSLHFGGTVGVVDFTQSFFGQSVKHSSVNAMFTLGIWQ